MRFVSLALPLALVTAHASAQDTPAPADAARETTPATWAMPAAARVLVAQETAPGVAAATGVGWGHTEDVLGAHDAHERIAGSVAFAVRPLRWLTIAARADGRWDHHLLNGGDDQSAVGELRLAVRGDVLVARGLALGAAVIGFMPGGDFPSLEPAATTVDARALAAWTPDGLPLTLALDVGYRFDGTRHAVPRPIPWGAPDLVSLGASDSDALLLGLAAIVHIERVELFAELSSDVLLGAGAAASPVRATAGVRVPLIADLLWLHAQLDVGLGGRLPVDGTQPLTPIEPRVGASVALVLAPRETRRPPPPVVTPPHPPPPVDDGVVHGRVLDPGGTPIAHATVRPEGATEPTATTDANGAFALRGVRPGARLEIAADGYATGHVVAGDARAATTTLERALPEGALRGLVRSSDGRALVAHVRVTPGDATATTDADGVFELALAPGSYDVEISASGHEPQTRHVDVEQGGVLVLNVDLRRSR